MQFIISIFLLSHVYGEIEKRSLSKKEKFCQNFKCPWTWKAVCGSDGVTYKNRCELRKSNCRREDCDYIKYRYEGKCKLTTCPTYCPEPNDESEQVCGEDGVTYGSDCLLDKSNCGKLTIDATKKLHDGECEFEECHSCMHYDYYQRDLCGTDGVTYKSYCEIHAANCNRLTAIGRIAVDYDGPCCEKDCNDQKANYICGTDSKTYRNECEMRRTACLEKRQINVQYFGRCMDKFMVRCFRTCSDDGFPVCGSDGFTYKNECWLQRHACELDIDIIIEYLGECDCGSCSREYEPVCGTDGVTYNSKCMLKFANCHRQQLELELDVVYVQYEGECCDYKTRHGCKTRIKRNNFK